MASTPSLLSQQVSSACHVVAREGPSVIKLGCRSAHLAAVSSSVGGGRQLATQVSYPPVTHGSVSSRHVAVRCAVAVASSYGIATAQGYGRNSMEDAYHVVASETATSPSFYGVFDGHGGGSVAKFLQSKLWSVYEAKIKDLPGDLVEATFQAFEETDKLTLEAPKGLFGAMRERGMGGAQCGSTANTALVFKQSPSSPARLVAANVGDGRTVLSRNGTAVQLSVDHKPDIESERLRIENKNPFPKQPLVRNVGGSWRVGGLLALSRAFGDVYLKDWSDGKLEGASGGFGLTAEPSVFEEDLQEGDHWLILASDGLWDVIGNQAAVDACNAYSGTDLNALAKELLGMAQSKGSSDDITVVVVKLQ